MIISDFTSNDKKYRTSHLNPIFRLIHSFTWGRMIPIKNGLVKILVRLV